MHACLPWNVWKSQHDVILPYEKFEATRGMLAPSLMVNPSIIHHLTMPCTPEQDTVVEQKIWKRVEATRAVLFNTSLST